MRFLQFNFAQLRDPDVGPLNLQFLEEDGYGTIIPAFWINENSKLTPDSTGSSNDFMNILFQFFKLYFVMQSEN